MYRSVRKAIALVMFGCFMLALIGCQKPVANQATNVGTGQQTNLQTQKEGMPVFPEFSDTVLPQRPPEEETTYKGQITPPDPYIQKNYPVTLDGVGWPIWRTTKEVALYKEKNTTSPVVTKVAAGEFVKVLGSELQARPVKLNVLMDYSTGERKFAKGDVLYVLYYSGDEGYYRVWHNGTVFWLLLDDVKGTAFYQQTRQQGKGNPTWGEVENMDNVKSDFWVCVGSTAGQKGWIKLSDAKFDRAWNRNKQN